MRNKEQVCATLDANTLDYLHKKINLKIYASVSHGIDSAIADLARREEADELSEITNAHTN